MAADVDRVAFSVTVDVTVDDLVPMSLEQRAALLAGVGRLIEIQAQVEQLRAARPPVPPVDDEAGAG